MATSYDPDEIASALFSVYFHAEMLGGPTPLDNNGRPIDPNALPSRFRILPLADAVSALDADEPPISFLRFAIVSLVRSVPANVDGTSSRQGPYIRQLAKRIDTRAGHMMPPAPPVETELEHILAMGTGATREARFERAYQVLWGKPLGTYDLKAVYTKLESPS